MAPRVLSVCLKAILTSLHRVSWHRFQNPQPALDMQSESASQGARIVPMWRRAVVRKVAVIAGVVFLLGGASIGIGTSLSSRQAGKSVASGAWASVMHSEDSSFDEAADYAMLDNQDIYASLLSESSGF